MGLRILAAIVCVSALAACAEKKVEGPSGSEEKKEPTTGYLLSSDCSTKQQTFTAQSADELKKKLCEALQDDNINGPCAHDLRKDMFDKRCSGYTWTLKTIPQIQVADQKNQVEEQKPETPEYQVSSRPQPEKMALRESLTNLLVDSYVLTKDLPSQEVEKQTPRLEAMRSCGLSYLGPKCVDMFANTVDVATVVDKNGSFRFYSLFETDPRKARYAYRFSGRQTRGEWLADKMQILKIRDIDFEEDIKAHLENADNTIVVAEISLSDDFKTGALNRLGQPRDLRELYHLSRGLLELKSGVKDPSLRDQVVAAIQTHQAVVVDSRDEGYQALFIEFLKQEMPDQTALLLQISENLLKSDSAEVQQIAAAVLLENQPSRVVLKPRVVEALAHDNGSVRKTAIQALGKTELTEDEEDLILKAIGDNDEPMPEYVSSFWRRDLSPPNSILERTKWFLATADRSIWQLSKTRFF